MARTFTVDDRKDDLVRRGITPAAREAWMNDRDYADALDYQVACAADDRDDCPGALLA